MSEPVDQEIEAIKSVLQALTPLSAKARASVLDYVAKRLDLVVPEALRIEGRTGEAPDRKREEKETVPQQEELHIKDLKDQKKPRSANEMAALVAYYLANLAPQPKRKQTVNQKDVETYFKIAQFPLPRHIRAALPNAKTAGYFDTVGAGEYKLNAVGHNLVVHSMPRGRAASAKASRPRKKAARKKAKAQTSRAKRT
jgi:hypothetical protein